MPLSGYAAVVTVSLAPVWTLSSIGPIPETSVGSLGLVTLGRFLIGLVAIAYIIDLARARKLPKELPRFAYAPYFALLLLLLEDWIFVNASQWGCLGCQGAFGGFSDLAAAALVLLLVFSTFPQCRAPALAAVVAGSLLAAVLALAGVGELGGSASATSPDLRLAGTFGNPNYLAYALTPAIPILIALRHEGSRSLRIAVWATCLLLGVTLVMTFSRTGLLSVAAGVIAVLTLQSRPGRRALTAGLLVLAVLATTAIAYPVFKHIRLSNDRKPPNPSSLLHSVDHSGWDGTAQGFIPHYPAQLSNGSGAKVLVIRAKVPGTGVSYPWGAASPRYRYTLEFSARALRRGRAKLAFGLEDNYRANGPRVANAAIGRGWRRHSLSWRPTAESPHARLYVWEQNAPASFALRDVAIARQAPAGGGALQLDRISVRLLGSRYLSEKRKLEQLSGTNERYYVQSRWRGAKLAVSAFASQPIRGIGWEQFPALANRHLPFGFLPTHDEYLRFAAELGTAGLILLVMLGVLVFLGLKGNSPGSLKVALSGALVAGATSLLFINGLVTPAAALWLVVACCVALTGGSSEPTAARPDSSA